MIEEEPDPNTTAVITLTFYPNSYQGALPVDSCTAGCRMLLSVGPDTHEQVLLTAEAIRRAIAEMLSSLAKNPVLVGEGEPTGLN